MKKSVLITITSIFCYSLLAQVDINTCGEQWMQKNRSEQLQDLINRTYQDAVKSITQSNSRSNNLLTIPVVVHIVYNTSDENISDEVVHSQIEVLNEDFQRLNINAKETRPIFESAAASANVQFVLADTDPNGNPTTGITRTQTDVRSFFPLNIVSSDILKGYEACNVDPTNERQFLDSVYCITNQIISIGLEKNAMKDNPVFLDDIKLTDRGGRDVWDSNRYLNIWVGNLTMKMSGMEQIGLLGISSFPVGAPNWPEIEGLPDNYQEDYDGVIIHYEVFGRDNSKSGSTIAAGGRTCTHEVGHYLGLRHISGDGYCGSDDGLLDTPPINANPYYESIEDYFATPTCGTARQEDTCLDDDLPDMIENYMDYSPQRCQNMFTQDQVSIMRYMLEGPRVSLVANQTTNASSINFDQIAEVYPNPTDGQLWLKLDNVLDNSFTVHVDNLVGQRVFSQIATSHKINLNISHLESGIYWLVLQSQEQVFAKKIILK